MEARLSDLIARETPQVLAYLGLSGLALALTGVADYLDPSAFRRFFGPLPPLAVVFGLSVLGLALVTLLLLDGRFAVYRRENALGRLAALLLALPFAAAMILVDRQAPFPADINVPFPAALFFYPAIAYVVEILFHLLPFCLLYFGLGSRAGAAGQSRAVWAALLLVALLEPAFQLFFTAGLTTRWVPVFLGVFLYAFNVVQLLLFRRYDFMTMYAFRVSYYLLWHIWWGHVRLGALGFL